MRRMCENRGKETPDDPPSGEKQKDPPYLADLLKYHPGLTREEALEMIKEAGGL